MASPQDHDDTYRAFDDFGFEDRQVLSELGRFQGRVNDEAYNDIHSDTLRCLCSLNYLQATAVTMVPREAIDKAMAFHLNFMQDRAKNFINYIPRIDDLVDFDALFDMEDQDQDTAESNFVANNAAFGNRHGDFFTAIKNYSYTLMAVGVENHYAGLILHQVHQGGISYISHTYIVDPAYIPSYNDLIWNRLQRILTSERGFRFAKQRPDQMWCPAQTDNYSCGLRVYDVLKNILFRVNEIAHKGFPHAYHPAVFGPVSGEFQPDKVRAEMIGILAYETMRYQNFELRILLGTFQFFKKPYAGPGGTVGDECITRGLDESWLLHPDRFARFQYQQLDDPIPSYEVDDGNEAGNALSDWASTDAVALT